MILFTYTEFLLVLLFTWVAGDVQVFSSYDFSPPVLIAEFSDLPAAFGNDIPSKGIVANYVYANPEHACTLIEPPPSNASNPAQFWGVLIKKGNCTFEEKVYSAQMAGYNVAIVHNVGSNNLVTMRAADPFRVWIPSVFIGETAATIIKSRYLYYSGCTIRIEELVDKNILIPLFIVVTVCMIVMGAIMVAKCIKDYRRARRRRLPCSYLSQIPTAKYKKNDPYETCAICLDDFIEGEKLRILPCSHSYHCKCIDPWLTRNRRVCPMCKRRVFGQNERNVEDSESNNEDDDNTPLLRSAQPTNGGTFAVRNFNSPFSQAVISNFENCTNDLDIGPINDGSSSDDDGHGHHSHHHHHDDDSHSHHHHDDDSHSHHHHLDDSHSHHDYDFE
ncbi:E3 ubiquitin-protein ligase RNF13-like isoform X2 [Cimex lectularius]|nr:E3 ubiquitin-protein ligase RNF13-like isoform X2 [Cimex lectularius]